MHIWQLIGGEPPKPPGVSSWPTFFGEWEGFLKLPALQVVADSRCRQGGLGKSCENRKFRPWLVYRTSLLLAAVGIKPIMEAVPAKEISVEYAESTGRNRPYQSALYRLAGWC